MATKIAITVCGLDESGALQELGVVETPLPAPLTAGAAINRLVREASQRAYAVATDQSATASLLRTVRRVARAQPDIAEFVWLRSERPALCFSRRVWEQAGGFDEAISDAQVLNSFANRVVSSRAFLAVELD